MMTIKLYQLVALVAGIALLPAAYFLAPPVLGGGTSYEIIRGSSMAPHLHAGDLAILRSQSTYSVGDAVAYHNSDLNRTVLHRIVRRAGGIYVFKGDNNNYLDSARATRSDLIGKLWLRVPMAGGAIVWFRQPLHALALLLVAVAALVLPRTRRTGNEPRRGLSSAPGPRPQFLGTVSIPKRVALVGGIGAASVVALLATLFLPGTSGDSARGYVQRGQFSYRGAVSPAQHVYPNGRLVTGDPIFLRLVQSVRVAFAWRFESSVSHALHGTAGLSAVIQSPEGWSRTIVVDPPRSFRGDAVTPGGMLRLSALDALVAEFQRETGTNDATYTVTFVPTIDVSGRIGSGSLNSSFSPPLQFQLTPIQLATAPQAVQGTGVHLDPFAAARSGTLAGAIAPTPKLLGIPVRELRFVLLLIALISLGATARHWLRLAVAARKNMLEGDRAARLFRDRLVEIDGPLPGALMHGAVDVPEARGLLLIAESLERPVLHDRAQDMYLVETDTYFYRYRAPAEGSAEPLRAADDDVRVPEASPAGVRLTAAP